MVICFVLLNASIFILTCHAPTSPVTNKNNELPDTPDGDTRLVVAIHDTPFKKDNKTVEKLNITVRK